MPIPPCQWPWPCQWADAVVGVKAAAPITAEVPRARASLPNMALLLSQGSARNVHPAHAAELPPRSAEQVTRIHLRSQRGAANCNEDQPIDTNYDHCSTSNNETAC